MSNSQQKTKKNYQIKLCKQNNAQYSFQIFSDIPTPTSSPSGVRTSAHVEMGSPRHYGKQAGSEFIFLSLCLRLEKKKGPSFQTAMKTK